MKASDRINEGASTSTAGAAEPLQVDDVIASISEPNCIDIDYAQRKYYPLRTRIHVKQRPYPRHSHTPFFFHI